MDGFLVLVLWLSPLLLLGEICCFSNAGWSRCVPLSPDYCLSLAYVYMANTAFVRAMSHERV